MEALQELQFINSLLVQLKLTRQEHERVAQAVANVERALSPKSNPDVVNEK